MLITPVLQGTDSAADIDTLDVLGFDSWFDDLLGIPLQVHHHAQRF